MIQLKKILVATDFSEHSLNAFHYAVEFSKAFDAEVILLHVAESADLIAQLPPGGESYFPPNLPEIHRKQAQEQGEKLIADAGLSSGRMMTSIGTPFVEIIRTAREEDVDMIIVGTHGRGFMAHMLLGSVAEKVVRKAGCPVLTVRKGEHEFIKP